MLSFIMKCLGWVLNLFYNIIGNYGFAIIVFTVFIKLVLFPLDLKQRRSMAKTQKIQPLMMEIQKKYANDKDKLNQETMKLYQKYGINPMGGCLPMLIQFPIIIALFWVVKKPIVYMMGVGFEDTWRIAEAFNSWAATAAPETLGKLADIIPVTYQKAAASNSFGNNEIQIAQMLYNHPEILEHSAIQSWGKAINPINFNFFGMNLAETPNLGAFLGLFSGQAVNTGTALLWSIPLLSGLSAWFSSYLTRPAQPKKDKNIVLAENEKAQEKTGAGADTMKTMTAIMPIFSAWFAFTLPAAIGLYWTISNIIQIAQHFYVKKFFNSDISLEELEGDIKNVKNRKKRKKSR